MKIFSLVAVGLSVLVLESAVAKLLGGLEDVDVSDEDAIVAAKNAFDQIEMRKNSFFESQFLKLTSAKKQIVSGITWWLTFQMGQTDCEKDFDHLKQNLKKDCKVQQVDTCKAKLYTVSWQHKVELQEFHCSPQESLVGGPMKQETVSQAAKDAAAFAVEYINSENNNAYRVALGDVKSVHTQVVAGIKYTISLTLGATKCKNNERNKLAALEQCPIYGKKIKPCDVVVVDTHGISQQPFSLLSCSCCKSVSKRHAKPSSQVLTGSQALGTLPLVVHGESLFAQNSDNLEVKYAAYWQGFKNKFEKQYSAQEELYRFEVFKNNMVKAETMQRAERGTAKYGITPFSDLTEEEFRKMLTTKWDLSVRPARDAVIPNSEAPDSFDWRQHGAVTPVKNQGQCGSCWAFSTTGNIEGQWKLKKGALLSLSEQELVDCDKVDQGCEGGLPSNAYKAIMKLGGLELEKDYAYDGEDEKCHFDKTKVKAFVNDSVAIPKDEAAMAAWLAKNGPISIGINANAMQWYMGGISHPWSIFCNPSSLDHGVLIVGYGTENDTPYWIVKNSWGPSWGEDGYYRVYRGAGVCGLNQMATSAVVE